MEIGIVNEPIKVDLFLSSIRKIWDDTQCSNIFPECIGIIRAYLFTKLDNFTKFLIGVICWKISLSNLGRRYGNIPIWV